MAFKTVALLAQLAVASSMAPGAVVSSVHFAPREHVTMSAFLNRMLPSRAFFKAGHHALSPSCGPTKKSAETNTQTLDN